MAWPQYQLMEILSTNLLPYQQQSRPKPLGDNLAMQVMGDNVGFIVAMGHPDKGRQHGYYQQSAQLINDCNI